MGVTKVPFRDHEGASRRIRSDGDGWVYLSVFSSGSAKVYKVGMTYQPRSRPAAGKFPSANPFGVELEQVDTKLVWFKEWNDARAFEQSILAEYAEHHLGGEWLRFKNRADEEKMLEDFREEEKRSVAARRSIGVDAAITRAAHAEPDARGRVVTHDLVGWGQISEALGVSRATAVRWRRRRIDPMPVRRFIGRIVAHSGELEEWARRQKSDGDDTV